jgi:hypothetical protein
MERKREKGQVLVVFVGALTALIGFAAVGVDVGYLYTVRHELQRCADAGALAGASAFLDGDWAEPAVRSMATTRAHAFASKDKVASTALDPSGEIAVQFPAQDRVRVDTSRTVDLFFSSMFLGKTKTISAHSTAEATSVGKNVKGLKPWGIPFPWEDDGDGLYEPGETVHKDCPGRVADPSRYFCPGTRVILKIGAPKGSSKNDSDLPSTQQESGHFFALSLDSTGGSTYRDTIVNGGQTPYSVGDSITLEPGNMVGPTVQGTRDLIDADSASSWNAAKNLPESDAFRIDDSSWMNSPRVIRIPVYDPEEALTNGRTEMVVAAFAGFWIESIEHHQGTVIGRFIPNKAFGNIGPGDGPTSGPALKVLRLVE